MPVCLDPETSSSWHLGCGIQSWPRLFGQYRGKVGVYCQLMGAGDADVLLNVLINPGKDGSEALEAPSMRHNSYRWKTIKQTLLINLSRHPQISQHNIPSKQRSFLSVIWLNQHHNSNLIICILTYWLNQKCTPATASLHHQAQKWEKYKLQHSFIGNRSYKMEFIIYLIWKKVLQYVNSNQSQFPKGTNHWNKLKLMCSASVLGFFFSCTSLPSAPKIRPQWTSGWS